MQELIAQSVRFALIGFFTSLTFLILWFACMIVIAIIAKILSGNED